MLARSSLLAEFFNIIISLFCVALWCGDKWKKGKHTCLLLFMPSNFDMTQYWNMMWFGAGWKIPILPTWCTIIKCQRLRQSSWLFGILQHGHTWFTYFSKWRMAVLEMHSLVLDFDLLNSEQAVGTRNDQIITDSLWLTSWLQTGTESALSSHWTPLL